MKIHEYQGKNIFKSYGIPIQNGYVIENIDDKSISKINFEKSINYLEENDFLFRSSKHHLTTVNSWRITEKTKKAFIDISKNKEINLNLFKKFVG